MSGAGWTVATVLWLLGALETWAGRVRTPDRAGAGWELVAALVALLWPVAVIWDLTGFAVRARRNGRGGRL